MIGSEKQSDISINPLDERDNMILLKNIIEVFWSKMIPMETPGNFTSRDILLRSQKDFIAMCNNIKYCFLGFNVKTLQECLDDYEFYLYLLSFFNKSGKMFRTFTYGEGRYEEVLSVSFYSYHSNRIEVLGAYKYCNEWIDSSEEYIHLRFLEGLKTLMHRLLADVVALNLDISTIELFCDKFNNIDDEGADPIS